MVRTLAPGCHDGEDTRAGALRSMTKGNFPSLDFLSAGQEKTVGIFPQ